MLQLKSRFLNLDHKRVHSGNAVRPSPTEMANCTEVDEEGEGRSIMLTVLLFVMICFIALSMGCTITVDALKEVLWQHG